MRLCVPSLSGRRTVGNGNIRPLMLMGRSYWEVLINLRLIMKASSLVSSKLKPAFRSHFYRLVFLAHKFSLLHNPVNSQVWNESYW